MNHLNQEGKRFETEAERGVRNWMDTTIKYLGVLSDGKGKGFSEEEVQAMKTTMKVLEKVKEINKQN